MKLKLDQVKLYANAKALEETFYYARNYNENDLLRCSNNFLAFLEDYETKVPSKIRCKLHNFSMTKDLASEVIRVNSLTEQF